MENITAVKTRIYLSSPHMSGNEIKYINEAMEQNWVAPLGPNVDNFEMDLAEYLGVRHVAALSSGTAAIHLALIILGVGYKDEVIAPSFTFAAAVNPIVYQGGIPILVDSERQTWNMSPELLEIAIKDRLLKGKKPKAIIAVHSYGMPANMPEIMEIADRYEIPVVEDAAEALGSFLHNKHVGTFGKFGVISFNGNKIITTSGGGALFSNEKEPIDKARFLSTQARDNFAYYQHSQIGHNYRMSNILAGIGRGQMEVIVDRIRKRRENFNFYWKELAKFSCLSFQNDYDNSYFSNHWLTTMLIDPEKTGKTWRDIKNTLDNENIESRPLWKPMHMQPVFSSCPSYLNGVSEYLFANGLCLPSGSNLTDESRMRVVSVIADCLSE